jgi:hypothetical protein
VVLTDDSVGALPSKWGQFCQFGGCFFADGDLLVWALRFIILQRPGRRKDFSVKVAGGFTEGERF